MRNGRVLFLMHEGVESTIFQSQVAVHALEMKKLGYEIEIWTFETTLKSLESSQQNVDHAEELSTCRVRILRGVYVFVPFSDLINSIILWFHLRWSAGRFDLVHARTDYSASVYSYIAESVRIPMIWDCRGDPFFETEYSLSKRANIPLFLRRIILSAITSQERRAGDASVAATFVSNGLLERKSRSLHGKPGFVIPCSVSRTYFYFSSQLRDEYRKRIGFEGDAIVLVYSGAMSTYQGFEKYVDLVLQLLTRGDSTVRLLIVTPDQAKARDYVANRLPEHVYALCSAKFEEMNGYLNAADHGMLLRDSNRINDVSSPTKFGEYCLAGLPVILDGNVQQAVEISGAIKNHESYHEVLTGKKLVRAEDCERAAIASRSQQFFSREYLNASYDAMYRGATIKPGEVQTSRTTKN